MPLDWSRGVDDIWSLASGAGGRVFFSVSPASHGVPPVGTDGSEPRIDNDVYLMGQYGAASLNTYYSSILISPGSGQTAQAADGITANYVDRSTSDLRMDLPAEYDPHLDFVGITAMEDFGVRTAILAPDRDLSQLQNLNGFVFFTVDPASPLIGTFGTGDVLVMNSAGQIQRYATLANDGSVIDGLAVDDDGEIVNGWPVYSGSDRILFSVRSTGSNGADLFLSTPGQQPTILVPAQQLGLDPGDDLVGLDLLDHVALPNAQISLQLAQKSDVRHPKSTRTVNVTTRLALTGASGASDF